MCLVSPDPGFLHPTPPAPATRKPTRHSATPPLTQCTMMCSHRSRGTGHSKHAPQAPAHRPAASAPRSPSTDAIRPRTSPPSPFALKAIAVIQLPKHSMFTQRGSPNQTLLYFTFPSFSSPPNTTANQSERRLILPKFRCINRTNRRPMPKPPDNGRSKHVAPPPASPRPTLPATRSPFRPPPPVAQFASQIRRHAPAEEPE